MIKGWARDRGGVYDFAYSEVYRMWWIDFGPEPPSWFAMKQGGENQLDWFEQNSCLDELLEVLPEYLSTMSGQTPPQSGQQELGL